MLDKIRIVLVNTSHPGNIGSAARAMKTMGLHRLVLVSPRLFPHSKAIEMSSHADDVLENAIVVETLEEALADCTLAIATSARPRSIELEPLTPRQCAETAKNAAQDVSAEIALVFGREDSGLTNEELLCCHYHTCIPSNPAYSSLNLAAAVQVLCYELRVAALADTSVVLKESREPKATVRDVESFYEHLAIVLKDLGFLRKESPTLMPKLRRLFNRIQLEKTESDILRGILTSVQKKRL